MDGLYLAIKELFSEFVGNYPDRKLVIPYKRKSVIAVITPDALKQIVKSSHSKRTLKLNYDNKVYKLKGSRTHFLLENPHCVVCNRTYSFIEICHEFKDNVSLSFVGYENGNKFSLTIDHIQPKSCGGTNQQENWQPHCNRCNRIKGSRIVSNEELREEIGIGSIK